MSEDRKWYLRFMGRVSGPCSLAELRRLRAQGKFSRFHEISDDGDAWSSAGALVEFFPPPVPSAGDSGAETGDAPSTAAVTIIPREDLERGDWYYVTSGRTLGPVSLTCLEELARAGGVAPTDFVWREGWVDWVPMCRLGMSHDSGRSVEDAEAQASVGARPSARRSSVGGKKNDTAVAAADDMALTSFILGITWVLGLGSVLAIVFGAMVLRRGRRKRAPLASRERELALCGVIFGVAGVLVSVSLQLFLQPLSFSGTRVAGTTGDTPEASFTYSPGDVVAGGVTTNDSDPYRVKYRGPLLDRAIPRAKDDEAVVEQRETLRPWDALREAEQPLDIERGADFDPDSRRPSTETVEAEAAADDRFVPKPTVNDHVSLPPMEVEADPTSLAFVDDAKECETQVVYEAQAEIVKVRLKGLPSLDKDRPGWRVEQEKGPNAASLRIWSRFDDEHNKSPRRFKIAEIRTIDGKVSFGVCSGLTKMSKRFERTGSAKFPASEILSNCILVLKTAGGEELQLALRKPVELPAWNLGARGLRDGKAELVIPRSATGRLSTVVILGAPSIEIEKTTWNRSDWSCVRSGDGQGVVLRDERSRLELRIKAEVTASSARNLTLTATFDPDLSRQLAQVRGVKEHLQKLEEFMRDYESTDYESRRSARSSHYEYSRKLSELTSRISLTEAALPMAESGYLSFIVYRLVDDTWTEAVRIGVQR